MGYSILWIIMGIIVGMIASSKGRSEFLWLFYGLLIWPIALVHALLLKGTPPARGWGGNEPDLKCRPTPERHDNCQMDRDCPFCAELIKKKAIKCKHCGSDVDPMPEPETPPEPEIKDLKNDVLNARARLIARAKTKKSES